MVSVSDATALVRTIADRAFIESLNMAGDENPREALEKLFKRAPGLKDKMIEYFNLSRLEAKFEAAHCDGDCANELITLSKEDQAEYDALTTKSGEAYWSIPDMFKSLGENDKEKEKLYSQGLYIAGIVKWAAYDSLKMSVAAAGEPDMKYVKAISDIVKSYDAIK